jgi:hypothetical protein
MELVLAECDLALRGSEEASGSKWEHALRLTDADPWRYDRAQAKLVSTTSDRSFFPVSEAVTEDQALIRCFRNFVDVNQNPKFQDRTMDAPLAAVVAQGGEFLVLFRPRGEPLFEVTRELGSGWAEDTWRFVWLSVLAGVTGLRAINPRDCLSALVFRPRGESPLSDVLIPGGARLCLTHQGFALRVVAGLVQLAGHGTNNNDKNMDPIGDHQSVESAFLGDLARMGWTAISGADNSPEFVDFLTRAETHGCAQCLLSHPFVRKASAALVSGHHHHNRAATLDRSHVCKRCML